MKLSTVHRSCLALLCGFLLARNSAQSEELADVSFQRDVQPILQGHCAECHGADEPESGLNVDSRAGMLRGGDSGEAALVPGDAANSLLIHLISGKEPDRQMPPDEPPLSPEQISILNRWIDQGVDWPGQMKSAGVDSEDQLATEHWSFQPLRRPTVPDYTFNLQAQNAITVEPQISTDLGAWRGEPDLVLVSNQPNGDGTATITYRSANPISAGLREYIRLRVSQ